jgi:2-polyprenyl-3-methyl-5-hydroxy-6-metoxy-1,4-benzoquinol methylase
LEAVVAQNIYDDPAFFAGYSEFPRSRTGLAGTSEWPAMQALLPAIAGKRVLDLGCGFGQLSRWLADEGAVSVLGIDLSEKMLARAIAETRDPAISYRRADLESLSLEAESFELIVSSMAFHYVEDFKRLTGILYASLVPGGALVFSIEHPIYAARAEPEWVTTTAGGRAFAIENYSVEGERVTNWIADGVVKYHRTIATTLNTLGRQGFEFAALNEWQPSEEQLIAHPEWRDTELIRPMFLVVSVIKPATSRQ